MAAVAALGQRLGHEFADPTLLLRALTHRSTITEGDAAVQALGLESNERLEFLGDAVLGLSISRRLMAQQGLGGEGALSRVRAALVNETALAAIAQSVGLGSALILGRATAKAGGGLRASVLADALEAVIGSVFVDGGFDSAAALVDRLFAHRLTGDLAVLVEPDFKTKLQEWTQDRYKSVPVYTVATATGPDHAKTFEVEVRLAGRLLGTGRGGSKKRASQEAARSALSELRQPASLPFEDQL